jgi:hypothetical protein
MLGWEMIHAVQQANPLRCRWVTCDEAFGPAADWRDRSAGLGVWYFAAVPHDTRVWRQRRFKKSAGLDLAPGAGAADRSPAQAGV